MKHICIISQRYPCEATPTVHVFVQKIAWAFRDLNVKITIISPVPINCRLHKGTLKYSVEYTKQGNKIEIYRPRFLYFGQKKFLVKISEHFFI